MDILAWGLISKPGGGYPRPGMDIGQIKMYTPWCGYPRLGVDIHAEGVDIHAQEFFITDCISIQVRS